MGQRRSSDLVRRLPILLILAVAVAGALLLRDRLSFEALAQHREALLSFRDAHYGLAVAGFVATYVAVVTFSLPGGLICTLTGGFLFGLFPGVFYNVAGASAGAVLLFLAARAGFGARFAERIAAQGGAAARLQAALRDSEWSVLFLMRLVPVVPFFVANLLPAFLNVPLHRFAISTVLGIVPGALVYTSVGTGLGEVLARGEAPDLGVIFTPPVLLPLLGLAALSALPIVVRLWRKGW
ncbi:VTT domain-containing protein [Cereibacter sphaeroides]|uniref:TVP38/TMEM64 family protein n=1 Tax=Cereibacter sphaeroides TaxID=1063 RepID=UPI001F23538E|nr:VTT domain-containing protein [Cereibacter sphaeroides]MCE6951165.1 VTT domain-containing protein [Cereibacter sphaeroides]